MTARRMALAACWLALAAAGPAAAQTVPAFRTGTPGAPEAAALPDESPARAGPQPPPSSAAPVPDPKPAPPLTISLLGRFACVTPQTRCLARAEGGFIDVANPRTNTLLLTLTGSTSANSYLGTTGSATEVFQLAQDIEIRSSDPSVQRIVLSFDSALVGMLRARRRASARVERATVSLAPLGYAQCPPIELAHPPAQVDGTAGRLCNQHLPPLRTAPLPLGRYTLSASFVLTATGSGIGDAHARADFSPETSEPDEWQRVRDPFQGVSKRSFGFITTITAEPAHDARR
jgi:hypothetical protein